MCGCRLHKGTILLPLDQNNPISEETVGDVRVHDCLYTSEG